MNFSKKLCADPKVVGVRKEHRDVIVGAALARFRELPSLRSPLAKAACLRDTVCHWVTATQCPEYGAPEVLRRRRIGGQ
jgi:hypothetical protein